MTAKTKGVSVADDLATSRHSLPGSSRPSPEDSAQLLRRLIDESPLPMGVVEIAAGRFELLESNLAMKRFLASAPGVEWFLDIAPRWLAHFDRARSTGVCVQFQEPHPGNPLSGNSELRELDAAGSTQVPPLSAIATHLGAASPGHDRYSILLIENPAICTVAAQDLDVSRERIARLERQLASRKVVERAKWVLVGQQGMTEPDAHFYLQKLARDRRQRVEDVAAEIVACGIDSVGSALDHPA